jgi:hypothetical protein
MDEDATAMMETPKKLLWCRTVLISLIMLKIAQITSRGVQRRG